MSDDFIATAIEMQIKIINEVFDAYIYVLDEYQKNCKKASAR